MKKTWLVYMLIAALVLSLAACGTAPAAANETPAEPQSAETAPAAAETGEPAAPAETAEPAAPEAAPEAATARKDGERFEGVVVLEGIEETVRYEHVVNAALGFEIDYDYENYVRKSEADRELFISDWDDPNAPENYLEVRYDAGNAELVASAIGAALSGEYEISTREVDLAGAGRCLMIDASEVKGGGYMAERLQTVYVIPAEDGCRVATEHFFVEGAEGNGRRFDAMVNTLTLLPASVEKVVSDEMALSAVRQYCLDSNPSLEEILTAGEHEVSWSVEASDEQEIVVLYRSYTGAELRFHIERATGETYVTERMPGIVDEEQPTDESLNVWDYIG